MNFPKPPTTSIAPLKTPSNRLIIPRKRFRMPSAALFRVWKIVLKVEPMSSTIEAKKS